MLSLAQLRAIMPALPKDRAEEYLPYLVAAMAGASIDTPLRMAAFLAQVAHESAELTRLEECLAYSADGLRRVWLRRFTPAQAREYAMQPERIGNRAYALRLGNGDEASGDGYRYRGRGPIQLTGRAQYAFFGKLVGAPLEEQPELASAPEWMFRVACAYWTEHGLNELADLGAPAFAELTARINSVGLGLMQRVARYQRTLAILAEAS